MLLGISTGINFAHPTCFLSFSLSSPFTKTRAVFHPNITAYKKKHHRFLGIKKIVALIVLHTTKATFQ